MCDQCGNPIDSKYNHRMWDGTKTLLYHYGYCSSECRDCNLKLVYAQRCRICGDGTGEIVCSRCTQACICIECGRLTPSNLPNSTEYLCSECGRTCSICSILYRKISQPETSTLPGVPSRTGLEMELRFCPDCYRIINKYHQLCQLSLLSP